MLHIVVSPCSLVGSVSFPFSFKFLVSIFFWGVLSFLEIDFIANNDLFRVPLAVIFAPNVINKTSVLVCVNSR